MSAWKLIVKRLHAHGGEGKRHQFDRADPNAARGILEAKRLGLVKSNGLGGRGTAWTLTELGRAYCEGRAEARSGPYTNGRPKVVIALTWLASLPQDIRLKAA